MEIKVMKCPNCDADLQIDTKNRQSFCQYCGAKLLVDDGIKRSIKETIVIDQARIKELELQERISKRAEERVLRHERERKKVLRLWAAFFLINIVIFIIFTVGCWTEKIDNDFTTWSVLLSPLWLIILVVGGVIFYRRS